MKRGAFVWLLAAVTLATFSLATTSADAKPKKDKAQAKQKQGKKLGGMFKGLELTAEQTKQIKDIQAEAKAQLKTLKEKPGEDKKAARAAAKEIQTSLKERTLAVLTDEQKAKLKELEAQRKEEAAKKRAEAKKNRADKPKKEKKPKKDKKDKKDN